MKKISTVNAREHFAEIINLVHYCKERIVITRREEALAVIISLEDFELLESIKKSKKNKE